jgi:hypothetical protein
MRESGTFITLIQQTLHDGDGYLLVAETAGDYCRVRSR